MTQQAFDGFLTRGHGDTAVGGGGKFHLALAARVDEDVGGLNVAVDEVARVQELEPVERAGRHGRKEGLVRATALLFVSGGDNWWWWWWWWW